MTETIRAARGAELEELGAGQDLLSLAQSRRAEGRIEEAAQLFSRRAAAGGPGDEPWFSRLEQARCQLAMGDEKEFLLNAIGAFNQAPRRAEPLYDLARFYRERSMYDASVLFCEAALALPAPLPDAKFVEEFVHGGGLLEEYSIAANYARDPARRDRGFAACNWLALSRDVPSRTRDQARFNLLFYACPAAEAMPSFTSERLEFEAPENYRATNPSVANVGKRVEVVIRAVNYRLNEDGSYSSIDGARFRTRNFLARLNGDLQVEPAAEVLPPLDMPTPAFSDEGAWGDMRLFYWHGQRWSISCYRELTANGWYEQVLARLEPVGRDYRLTDWRVLRPTPPARHEKNWMPMASDEELEFIYLCDPTRILDDQARLVREATPSIAVDHFRGGSQAVHFDDGWLALIHEVVSRQGRRFYLHRFVAFSVDGSIVAVSRPFFFRVDGVEFVCGLAWNLEGDRLLISFGVNDGQAWMGSVAPEDVRAILENIGRMRKL